MARRLTLPMFVLALALGPALEAAATPLLIDPIVRTRQGTIGSIPIFDLPFVYDFYPGDETFPSDPDGTDANCITGFENDLFLVTCEFQNFTGQAITLLDFDFLLPDGTDPDTLIFVADDPDNLFDFEDIDEQGALFTGGLGIPTCTFDGEFCFGGHFLIDLVGFPEGTRISMLADVAADAVPEPATLTLLATGLGLAAARRRRRAR